MRHGPLVLPFLFDVFPDNKNSIILSLSVISERSLEPAVEQWGGECRQSSGWDLTWSFQSGAENREITSRDYLHFLGRRLLDTTSTSDLRRGELLARYFYIVVEFKTSLNCNCSTLYIVTLHLWIEWLLSPILVCFPTLNCLSAVERLALVSCSTRTTITNMQPLSVCHYSQQHE